MRSWLNGHVWESEDGPSRRALRMRSGAGENLVAISGIGSDDEAMLRGVRIFDVSTGAEVAAFAGPAGALFGAEGRLCSAGPDGLEVWDPLTGERIAAVPGFVPAGYHPAVGELAGISSGVLRRCRIR